MRFGAIVPLASVLARLAVWCDGLHGVKESAGGVECVAVALARVRGMVDGTRRIERRTRRTQEKKVAGGREGGDRKGGSSWQTADGGLLWM